MLNNCNVEKKNRKEIKNYVLIVPLFMLFIVDKVTFSCIIISKKKKCLTNFL